MKLPFDTVQENIGNLTSLWTTAAMPFHQYTGNALFSYCKVPDSQWPNRLWFHQDLTPAALEQAFQHDIATLTIPYWDLYGTHTYELLEARGYTVRSEQAGMSMPLTRLLPQNYQFEFIEVDNLGKAFTWKEIFIQAFGYLINEKILMQSLQKIRCYIAYYKGQPVGTAMLYITGTVAGIHSVGVIPELRRKGVANEIMQFILNQGNILGCSHATLQASKMGKGLYLRLGFEEQFVIKNYYLQS